MSLLVGHICALALLAGSAPSPEASQQVGAQDVEWEAVLQGGREYVAVLATMVRAAAGIDESARAAMLALLDGHVRRAELEGRTLGASELAAAFDAWSSATARLGAQQRSDALLIADRVMEVVSEYVVTSVIAPEPPLTATMRLAGAEFRHDKLASSYVYAHTFLRQARRVAATGAARDRVLLREMEIGFDYRGQCSAGDLTGGVADITARVIAAGEALLSRSKDPRLRVEAHLIIADAYATIVTLANGGPAAYFDASAYRPRENAARREAIAHYRAGLAIDPHPPDAELIRNDLQRLLDGAVPHLAGGPARWRMFACVYD